MEELDFIIKYSFSNYLNNDSFVDDPTDFVNEIDFEVFLIDESGLQEQVAKGKMSHILFSLAMDLKFPLFEVMDVTSAISEISSVLFEWDIDKDYWDKLHFYSEDYPLENFNICLLESLEIIAKYRGKRLGKKIINSLIKRFYSSCGLWVLKAYPIQFDLNTIRKNEIEWNTKMDYLSLEEDFEKAQYQIFDYYAKMGFENPFEMEYFIIKPFDFITKNNQFLQRP